MTGVAFRYRETATVVRNIEILRNDTSGQNRHEYQTVGMSSVANGSIDLSSGLEETMIRPLEGSKKEAFKAFLRQHIKRHGPLALLEVLGEAGLVVHDTDPLPEPSCWEIWLESECAECSARTTCIHPWSN